MNSREQGQWWHEKLVGGDPTASAELIRHYFPAMVRDLRLSRGNDLDEDTAQEVALEALEDYILNPQKFKPEAQSLLGYLRMSARKDLLNELAKRSRKEKREISLVVVENANWRGNKERVPLLADETFVSGFVNNEANQAVLAKIHNAFPDERDRVVLELMAQGERSADAYIEALRIADLSQEDQRREVKRNKDRVKKRAQRLGIDLS